MLYNIHKAEDADAKNEDDLMRDRAEEIISRLQGIEGLPELEGLTFDEQREAVKRMIIRDMGIS